MNSFIVKEGYLVIGLFFLTAVLLAIFIHPAYAVLPFGLSLFSMYFFRNPSRKAPHDDTLLVSPADGTVKSVVSFYDYEYLDAPATKVTIFLSVFNVHVNRSPMRGEVNFQRYTCGGFCPAYKKEASFENERHAIGIENEHTKILVIQIAGIIAKRIVSWIALGSELEQGERLGMIKFGSCTELIFPEDVEVFVKKGDKVKGGVTVIGKL